MKQRKKKKKSRGFSKVKALALVSVVLAVAVGVVLSRSGKVPERRVSDPRYLDPIYLAVPKDFAPIQPALGKEIEGKRSTYIFDPSSPRIRFSVSRGGREYWLESELQEPGIRNQEARVVQKGNSVIWNEIFPKVTARYDTYDGYVKETFILADANAPRSFTFTLTPGPDVTLDDSEGGYVMVKAAPTTASGAHTPRPDESGHPSQEGILQAGEELFMLRPPQGLDARSFRVDYKYRLEKVDRSDMSDRSDRSDKSEYRLTLYPSNPAQYEDAVYPVSVDPSHQVVEWDEALVKVGENCDRPGCDKDGDIIELKPSGWNWGTSERREFVIVKVPKMSRGQREEHIKRTDEGVVQYAIDYTQLATPEELSVIRDPKQISPQLDATDKPEVIQRKSELKASVIPLERRLAYSPPLQPSGLKKILLALIKSARAATTVTSSIGTASRDYSTLQAWETAKNGNLVTADQVQKGEAYNDSIFTGNVLISGSTTDSTRYMWLTVASGNRHSGSLYTSGGVRVETSATYSTSVLANDDYTTVDWLQVQLVADDNSGVNGSGGNGTGIKLMNLILYAPNAKVGTNFAIQNCCGGGATSSHTRNNLVYGPGWDRGIIGDWGQPIHNNTVYNTVTGIISDVDGSNTVAKNNLSVGNTTNYSGTFGASSSNNLSSSATVPGTSSLASRTVTTNCSPGAGDWVIFTSTTGGSEDFHLQNCAENDAIDNGADLSSTFTIDIDNQTRSAPWDMGADEFVSTNSTPTITSVTDTPDPTNPNRSVTFSTDWNDADSGETVKVKICSSDALGADQVCDGTTYASSTAFTTSDPESVTYDIQGGDAGTTITYYAFVCDDSAACNASGSSGTVAVNAQSTIPNIKVRGGLKVR